MLTNIIATLVVVVSTNVFAPKQYWQENHIVYCGSGSPTYAQQSGSWQDYPAPTWGVPSWSSKPTERDNPDVRITEVREIKTLSFEFDGKPYIAEHSNVVLSSKRENRVVTAETSQTNGMTITTTVERWVEQ